MAAIGAAADGQKGAASWASSGRLTRPPPRRAFGLGGASLEPSGGGAPAAPSPLRGSREVGASSSHARASCPPIRPRPRSSRLARDFAAHEEASASGSCGREGGRRPGEEWAAEGRGRRRRGRRRSGVGGGGGLRGGREVCTGAQNFHMYKSGRPRACTHTHTRVHMAASS